jgi:hypothetical protein
MYELQKVQLLIWLGNLPHLNAVGPGLALRKKRLSPPQATPRANVLALELSPVWPLNLRDHLGFFPVSDP